MRNHISCSALGLALVAAAPAANAQTVYTQQPDGTLIAQQPLVTVPSAPVVTQPVQTVRTIETVRTVRPIGRRRVVVTRQTVVRESVVPTTRTVVAPAVTAAYPQPLYDEVVPAQAPVEPAPYYRRPLYDDVVPATGPVGTAVPFYRYVYEPDRILVIDPNTNITVQSLPR
jgi:hypothetical protein